MRKIGLQSKSGTWSVSTKDLAFIALFIALTAAGAFIRVPIPIVPFTLQFLFTTLSGLLLGAGRGAVSVACYVMLGLMGLPIFAGGGGIFYVLEPTFGYLVGFAAGAFVTGRIAWKKGAPTFGRAIGASFAGLGTVYVLGMAYYYLICNLYLDSAIGIGALLLYCFVLAVPGDICLCFVAAITAKRLYGIFTVRGKKKMNTEDLKEKVLSGQPITREEALSLVYDDLERLCSAADEIRRAYCGNGFDLCAIVNAKCGKCGEDCKFCAQSIVYRTDITEYPLLEADEMVKAAAAARDGGALRFSAVTSGGKLSDKEVAALCENLKRVRNEIGISLCVSVGLVSEENFLRLKAAGVRRVHCNLETSRGFFPQICTTHTYDDKLAVLRAARRVGLDVCSGGIIGLGESWLDRIDMAMQLRDLGVKSVPVNFLNPIAGTPFERNAPLSYDEQRRAIAVFRFILPDASIRLAGGRALLPDRGRACFTGGANAAITGDMLTTGGVAADYDTDMLSELGYEVKLYEK